MCRTKRRGFDEDGSGHAAIVVITLRACEPASRRSGSILFSPPPRGRGEGVTAGVPALAGERLSAMPARVAREPPKGGTPAISPSPRPLSRGERGEKN